LGYFKSHRKEALKQDKIGTGKYAKGFLMQGNQRAFAGIELYAMLEMTLSL